MATRAKSGSNMFAIGGGRDLTPQQAARAQAMVETGKAGKCGVSRPMKQGAPCPADAGAGTDHVGYGPCIQHHGNTAQGKGAAARERAWVLTQEVKRASRFYNSTIVVEITAEQALQEEVGRAVGIVRWIEGKLGQWGFEDDSLFSTQTGMPQLMDVHESMRNVTVADTEYAAWLRMYQVERIHLARTAKMCIDAGISQQLVTIWTRQADTMNRIITAVCAELGVPMDRLPEVMPRVIREITAQGEVKEVS